MTATDTRTNLQKEFIESLEALDAGERARLKRNAGRDIGEARNVTGLFYRLLPYSVINRERQHQTYFLVATLFPITDSKPDLAEHNRRHNLGATLNRIRTKDNANALDRRMNTLLDSDAEQLRFRLRQIIRLIESHQRGVNWEKLLTDLLTWNRDDRRVQRQWAMSYYGLPERAGEGNEEGADADSAHSHQL